MAGGIGEVQRCGIGVLENGDVESEFVEVQRCRIGVSEFRSRDAEVWREQKCGEESEKNRGAELEFQSFRAEVWR